MFFRIVSVMKPPPPAAAVSRATRHDDVDIVVGKDETAGRGVGGNLCGDGPRSRRQDRGHEALAFADQLRAAQRLAAVHGDAGDRCLSASRALRARRLG